MGNTYCDREQEHKVAVQRAREGILASADVEKVSKVFQMLSDPGRLRIVLALLNGEMCVYHLTEISGGSFSGVSHQLRVLRDSGIVKSKRMGKNVEYSIADNHVRKIVEMGVEHLRCSEEKL